jgi:regulation of enolase protein 1 (concanavalin A-like superfamily)
MNRLPLVFALSCAGLAAVAAPVPKDNEGRIMRLYGAPHDPDKGAEFRPSGDTLRIIVPDEPRLLSAWTHARNAPCVWRDVAGDFTVSVRVSFPIRSEVPRGHTDRGKPHAGGGLVVWTDAQHFLTATRNEQPFGAKPTEHFRCEVCLPERSRSAQDYSALNRSGFLRVQRTGNELEASYSTDGKKWTSLGSHEAAWGDTVKVGVIAENTLRGPFEAVFDEYVLTRTKQ